MTRENGEKPRKPTAKVPNAALGGMVPVKTGADKSVQTRRSEARMLMNNPARTNIWLKWRCAGKTDSEIAESWNVEHPKDRVTKGMVTIFLNDFVKAFSERNSELATVVRANQLGQLDQMMDSFLPDILGDGPVLDRVAAARIVLQCQKQVAELVGAYAPQKREITGADGGPIPVEHDFSAKVKDFMSLIRKREKSADAPLELPPITVSAIVEEGGESR